MATEYNPAGTTDEAIAPPISPTPDDEPLRQPGIKALNSERQRAEALEREKAQLLAMAAEKDRQLQQAQMTLEQKYQADLEASRQAYQAQVDAIAAQKQAELEQEREARLAYEQRTRVLEDRQAADVIVSTLTSKISGLLVDPDQDLDLLLSRYGDNIVLTNDGEVVATDGQTLSPLEDLIAFFQNKHPRMFKPPAQQKIGGGQRNLAALGSDRSGSNGQKLQLPTMGKITPEQFLANREAITKGDFEVVK